MLASVLNIFIRCRMSHSVLTFIFMPYNGISFLGTCPGVYRR